MVVNQVTDQLDLQAIMNNVKIWSDEMTNLYDDWISISVKRSLII